MSEKKRKPLDLEGFNVETIQMETEEAAIGLGLIPRKRERPIKRSFRKGANYVIR
jgi:hypothetical protein